jgi:hypothetical protein
MSRAFFAKDKATFARLADEAEEQEATVQVPPDEDTGHREPDGDEGKHPQNVHIHVEHAGGNGDSALADRVTKLEDGVKGIGAVLGRMADKMGIRDADLPEGFKKNWGKEGEDKPETPETEDGEMPAEVKEHFEQKSEDSDLGGDLMHMGNENGESGLTMSKPPASSAELVEADPALKQEKTRMGDAAYKSRTLQAIGNIVRDTVARAEILHPGIKVPTLDAGGEAKWPETQKRLHGLRRNALVELAKTDKGKEILGNYAPSVGGMSYDAMRIIFADASAKMRAMNNAASVPSPMFGDMAGDLRAHRSRQVEIVRGINSANHDYWTKQGVTNMGPRRVA